MLLVALVPVLSSIIVLISGMMLWRSGISTPGFANFATPRESRRMSLMTLWRLRRQPVAFDPEKWYCFSCPLTPDSEGFASRHQCASHVCIQHDRKQARWSYDFGTGVQAQKKHRARQIIADTVPFPELTTVEDFLKRTVPGVKEGGE